ncbi:HlyD family type I secretion periplasmic adaptor subunit [Paenibacillus sp. LMG 31459]|uniref:HlyD family type I secretion periplasmic adaptor subunit n=1 Tax=Paenibacillus phytohabitans TaxID=2654978 RepID=A0ABX1YIR9_9BACL|nr:HlyD family type I secretion periplasmic adaptor subunit [Paenibacillus phytohabitans]NOU80274.1 HlyD family type I secretion periplasmic adaptor subunit [Paenibacillus phytohabitans]
MFGHKSDRLEYEFLPAAVEIEETPPAPLGRWLIWTIIILFVIVLVWSYLGKVDEVAVARGKVIPDGRTKVLQPLEGGTIKEVMVTEGEHVEKGQLLIELDSTTSEADIQEMVKQLYVAKLQKAMLEAELAGKAFDGIEQGETPLAGSAVDEEEVLQVQMQLREARDEEFDSKIKAAELVVSQTRQELHLEQSALELANKDYALALMKSQNGGDENFTESADLLQADNDLNKTLLEIDSQEKKIAKAEDALAEAEENVISIQKQRNRTVLDELVENEKTLYTLESELTKAEKRFELQQLASPVDGTVHGLSSFTIGGVVTSAEDVISIVPDDTPLIIEATIANQDIGFIKKGQAANVKVDTFPFQKYGYLQGEIIYVSPDAFEDEKLGPVFKAKLKVMSAETSSGNQIRLSPGMSVSVEAKTGQRRIIDFFLSPLKKVAEESFTLR